MEDKNNEAKDNSNLVGIESYTGVDFGDKDIDHGTLKLIQANFNDPIIMAKYICEENPNLVRCGEQGMLYRYNGKYYDFISDKDLDSMVMNFCLKYNVTKAFKIASPILRALNVFPLVTSIKEMNPNENLINLNNGVLDIYTKKFTKHSPKYYFDYALEVNYNPEDIDCPVFMNFLDDVMSHEQDSIDNIIKLGGYLLDSSRKAKKCFFFDGDGGCLDKDTFISYDVESNGKRINHKGGSIEMLYNRFHGDKVPSGKGGYHLRSQDKNLAFYVPSVNENNSIFSNRIVDVIKSGIKKCYKLITKEGKTIIATGTHKFFNGNRYIPLNKLSVGDTVYIHNNIHFKNKTKQTRIHYKEVMVKYHPSNHIKVVNGCTYYRVKRCRLVVEANINNMPYNEYVKALNSWSRKDIYNHIKYLGSDYDVHHINHNRIDDRLENLKVMIGLDHDKLHAAENYNKMRFIAVPDNIISIECVGKRETYDIKCLDPYNNFIANGLVVHNSGKSTLMDTFIMFFPEREIHPVVSSLSLDVLSGGGFDRSDLIYSRLNTCAETRKTMVNSEFLKLMVTGDPIQVSRKYDDPYTFRYKGVVVLLGNGLPRFNDTSDGIYRRIVIVKFKNQYKPKHELENIKFAKERRIFAQDPDLPEKIKKESSAILNLFIQGLIDLREKNYQFIESASSQEAMVEFRRESDTVREFLESNYELSFDDETPLSTIFMEFRLWYMDNVQDSKSMKFRSAEMAKRIKEVFKIDSSGRKKYYNANTKTNELLTVYNVKKKNNLAIIDGELVDNNKEFDISKATDADMEQLGMKY